EFRRVLFRSLCAGPHSPRVREPVRRRVRCRGRPRGAPLCGPCRLEPSVFSVLFSRLPVAAFLPTQSSGPAPRPPQTLMPQGDRSTGGGTKSPRSQKSESAGSGGLPAGREHPDDEGVGPFALRPPVLAQVRFLSHPDPPRQFRRGGVPGVHLRDNAVESVMAEGDAQYGDGGLGGEAVTAGGRIEGPPDLCLLITAVLEPETDVADEP